MATIVVAHGAWSSAWAWKKMRPLMRDAGHELFVPTYTGLGERAHLANDAVDLDTHIADVLGTLKYEDLREVTLVGHSYGGMVATGVADRARDRIKRLVYLDAFVPRDGQSLADISGRRDAPTGMVEPNPPPPDTPKEDLPWIAERRLAQPAKCFSQKLRLSTEPAMPRAYIYCRRAAPGDVFRQFLDRARAEGWRSFEIDSSHNPHITCPETLRDTFEQIVR
jgi:pimeloyl-ACP methyl ester carboxylesterase